MQQNEMHRILTQMLQAADNISDLNITVGKPFQVEASGQLVPVAMRPDIDEITPFQSETLAFGLMRQIPRLVHQLLREGACDFSYNMGGKASFRVNIFAQRTGYSCVLRRLETVIPTISELGLPSAFYDMSKEKNGLILVTGATGSGKSTSLAALLNEINEKLAVHVITLEDPVEFVHPQKTATFNQRELGQHFDHYSTGLRFALRQAPKVIMVGEMRDRETMDIGLSAAETGHLVMSTLHTVDAGQTVNRVVGLFEPEEEPHVRNRLADCLRWICCQRLLPREGGGRIAAFELMGTSLRVKSVILDGETEENTFNKIIQDHPEWWTFNQSILEHYKNDLVSEETALSYATRRPEMRIAISNIKRERGIEEPSSGPPLSIEGDRKDRW